MNKRAFAVTQRPNSQNDIEPLVRRLLAKADAFDVLPTPVDRLYETAKILQVGNLPDPDSNYLKILSESARRLFVSAKQKIRGIADMRTRVVYIPKADTSPRILFAKSHELGHQCMDWHNVNLGYQDTNYSLSPRAKEIFEQEANYFGAEVIFQGDRFRIRARDYRAEFNSVFYLASLHGASRQATAWRFVEEQDVPVAALHYYPSIYEIDQNGSPVLTLWKVTASPKFLSQSSRIELPATLQSEHPWAAARDTGQVVSGTDKIGCGSDGSSSFQWQSWWNRHALIVLLTRKPTLSVISSLLSA